MVRVSNLLITSLNCLTLVASLVAIGSSIWFQLNSSATLCQKVLHKPLLILGLSLLVFSILGLVGSWCRVTFFMWMYQILLFLIIVGLIVFSVFTILVTNKGVGKALSGRGFKDVKFGDYSRWLQKYVVSAENWEEITSCLAHTKFCHLPADKDADFYKYNLSTVQSSCCKPPTYCGFEFKNATYWIMPKTGPAVPDNDCMVWSNVQTQLCFNCHSCKSAFLDNIKKDWKKLSLVNFCVLVLVLIVYSVGCCALRNNRSQRHKRYP